MNDAVINEKLINYCSGKNLCNLAKINLCSLIEKIIDKKRNNIQLNSYTNLLIKISKYLEDQNPEVREKSAKLMAYINFIKKDLFNSISNSIKLDNKKKDKIFEYEKLFINFSYNKNAQSNEKKVNKNKEKIKEINSNLEPKNTEKKLIDYDRVKNLNNKENISNKTLNNYISAENNISIIKDKLIENKEEIISYMQKMVPNLNNSLFNSLKWEERKEGFSIIYNFLYDDKNLNEIKKGFDYFFKYILINNKFFNEKNFLVLNESIHCINCLIEKVDEFTKNYYKIIIPLLTNKINEKKVIPEIINTIKKLIEKISTNDLIIIFINSLKNKQNNFIKEGIEIMKNIINESRNLNDYPLQEIINFCIEIENNPNNMLRKASTQILCSLYKILDNLKYLK